MASQAVAQQVLRRNLNGVYEWRDLVVSPTIPESLLGYAYLRFEEENTLPLVFHEGVPTLRWFLEHFLERTQMIGCWLKQPQDEKAPLKLLGLGWVTSLTLMSGSYKKAEVGMSFFRGTDSDTLLRCGQMMIEWAFARMGLDAMFGATPAPNRAALIYRRKLGFKTAGPVEGYTTFDGKLCDAWISWLLRSDWEEARPFTIEE